MRVPAEAREADARRLRYREYMRRNPYREAPVSEEGETKAPTTEEELKAATRQYLAQQELRAETRDYYLRKSVIKLPSTFAELQASLQDSTLPAVFLFLPLKSINSNGQVFWFQLHYIYIRKSSITAKNKKLLHLFEHWLLK